MKLLSRHLVGLYLRSLALCTTGAVVFVLVIEFFSRIGDFAAYDSHPALVASYFALKSPRWLVEVYPAASLLAVLLGVGSLVRTNEVLAMQACGLGLRRIGAPLLAVSTLLSGLTLVWNETVVPPCMAKARAIKDLDIKGMNAKGMLDATSLWTQVPLGFLHVDLFDATRNRLEGITLHQVDAKYRLEKLVEIPAAQWDGSRWVVESGTERRFDGNGESTWGPLRDPDIDFGGTPADFRKKAPRADEFSMRQLATRIEALKAKGMDPAAFETDLHFKFALPLSGILTVLLGLPLALRGSTRTGTAQHVGTGLALCFAYWLTQALTVSAGHAAALPPVVAAWSANALFALFGGILALRR